MAEMWHVEHGSAQLALPSSPMHMPTQTPMFVSGSTSQHIARNSRSSMPLTPESTTVHGWPTAAGSSASGVHRVAFQLLPPSFTHGMHFSPRGQSCFQTSHSIDSLPPSGSMMNPTVTTVGSPASSDVSG